MGITEERRGRVVKEHVWDPRTRTMAGEGRIECGRGGRGGVGRAEESNGGAMGTTVIEQQ